MSVPNLPWPTSKNEAFKYTNLAKLLENDVNSSHGNSASTLVGYQTALSPLAGLPVLFHPDRLPAVLLRGQTEQNPPCGPATSPNPAALKNPLTQALFSQTPSGFASTFSGPENPTYVLDISGDTTTNLHTQFTLEKSAKATLITLVQTPEAALTHTLTEISLQPNSTLNHIILNLSSHHSLAHTYVETAQDATYNLTVLNLHNSVLRQDVEINFNGQNAHCSLNAVTLASTGTHQDFTMRINHNTPHCTANVNSRNVVADNATAVFQGKFFVDKIAQKTDANMLCKNLLLGQKSVAYAKPELEIYADDVKCSHGATTGALDQNSLFYLAARGLSPSTAKRLLTEAFVQDILEDAPQADLLTALTTPTLEAML